MSQPLDNYFRDKLGNAHKPAPPAAWQKIDAGLAGRQRKGLWFKVAAAILIVAVGSFVLWPAQQQDTPPVVAQEENSSHQPALQPAAAEPATPLTALSETPVASKKKTRVAPQQSPNPLPAPTPGIVYENEPMADNGDHTSEPRAQQLPDLSVTPEPVQPASAVVLASAAPEEPEQSVILVYSADEVDEKYLDKDALAKATSAHKKSSTFRKLLDKAYDLKNNQDPFGGLRQKKNEILALNFKSEKRSQNK